MAGNRKGLSKGMKAAIAVIVILIAGMMSFIAYYMLVMGAEATSPTGVKWADTAISFAAGPVAVALAGGLGLLIAKAGKKD